MRFGSFDITPFVEREFRLDGGSMFGVIPKSMWQKLLPADENNLIPMVTNLFILRAHGQTLLFDAGLGDSLTEREEKIYGTVGPSRMTEGLAGAGVTADDIDVVILTHLHTDHCAGTVKRVGERFVPRFPNATVIASRREWQAAMNPNERTTAVYIPERLKALEASGRLELIDFEGTADSIELLPGVRAVHTGGHSDGHLGLEIESGGQKVWYHADIYPTIAHLRTAYIPATDLYPLDTMAVKHALLPRIIEEEVILALDHDTRIPLARISMDGKSPVAIPA